MMLEVSTVFDLAHRCSGESLHGHTVKFTVALDFSLRGAGGKRPVLADIEDGIRRALEPAFHRTAILRRDDPVFGADKLSCRPQCEMPCGVWWLRDDPTMDMLAAVAAKIILDSPPSLADVSLHMSVLHVMANATTEFGFFAEAAGSPSGALESIIEAVATVRGRDRRICGKVEAV